MTELLTSAQMRAIEQAAIESGSATGLELMERAGQGVVDAIFAEWPELAGQPGRVLVLCGPGNNGGDGFVVARLLLERGWEVKVFLFGEPDRLPPDAAKNHQAWCRLGKVAPLKLPIGDETYAEMVDWVAQDKISPLYLIDALFGTGLRRSICGSGPDGLAMLLVELDDLWMNKDGPVLRGIAIDIPSGLCADSGRLLQDHTLGADELRQDQADQFQDPRFWAFQASLTVTFHTLKPGHILGFGPRMCGNIRLVDIGIAGSPGALASLEAPWLRKVGKWGEHKYSHGHALILSGPAGQGGASRLAARGALRIGAGLVTIGCPSDAIPENAAQLNAIMLREVEDKDRLHDVLSDKRINAVCIGPGLGLTPDRVALIAAALAWPLPQGTDLPIIDATDEQVATWHRKHGHRPAIVLDADALTLLSRDPDLFAQLHDRCILTPHAGEFARLFPDIAEKLAAPATRGPAYSKVDATREAAARAGCVVLYKGPDTVIADPSGRCAINASVYDRAAPWLATAGSGDVLAGFITGLLARGFAPFDAACTGAWLHTECALSFGPGLIAEDLPEQLPKVFRTLGL